MKYLQKLTALLCALALVLALAPAAFAEDITETDGTYEKNLITVKPGESITVTDSTASNQDVLGDDSTVIGHGGIDNQGTIKASNESNEKNDSSATVYSNNGDLVNHVDAQITTSADKAIVGAWGGRGDIKNSGTIKAEGNVLGVVDSNEDIQNNKSGTITAKATGDAGQAMVSAKGDLVNDGKITVEAGGDATITAGGTLTNNGEIIIDAANGENALDEDTQNCGTIIIKAGSEETKYFGVNYVDEQGKVVETALDNWMDGKADNALNLTAPTRDGYTFGGWQFADGDYKGTVFNVSDQGNYKINDVFSITALWNAILKQAAPVPSGSDWTPGEPEKKDEEIKEVLDLRVLDADRKELTKVEDFYLVARTTRDRLIVLFTDVQLKNLPSGENLFYIILPDGAEVEYTLQIA